MAKLYVKNSDGSFTPHSSIAVTNLDVVQGKGDSLTSAMSQKAVTDELAGKQDTISDIETIRSNAQNASDIVANMTNAGYLFAGIATPTTDPGTPDAKVFYIANGKGTYTNFGGIEVMENEVVVLYYDTAWHKEATGIASQEKLTELQRKEFKFSDNAIVNTYIKEVYIADPPANFTPNMVTFLFLKLASSNNKYNNIVRIGYTSSSKFVDFAFYYDTLEEAINGLHSMKGIIKYRNNYINCDFSEFPVTESYGKSFSCSYYDTTILANSPCIMEHIYADRVEVKVNEEKTRATNAEAGIIMDINNLVEEGFSNNIELNKIVKELYIYDVTPIKKRNVISIRCGLLSSSTGKYYNAIRIGIDGQGPDFGYVDLMKEDFDTQEQALAAMRGYSVISTSEGVAIVDLSSFELGYVTFRDFTSKDYSKLYNAPSIAIFLGEYIGNEDHETVLVQANNLAINGDNAYQCPDQFKSGSLVKVYKQGLLVNPNKYTLFKQGKVQFNDVTTVPSSDILFEYEKNTKHIDSLSLPLDSPDQLNYITEDGSTQLYSFVNDPIGGEQKVMMLHCSQIAASKVRMQFSLKNLHATYFHDRVKMFLPTDMKNALMSYNRAINWFSIGGSWGIFGSPTGQLNMMFSGSANSFDIYKDDGGDRLYYHLLNRRRDVNTTTGLEEYTVLSEGSSDFDVLDNEWITIEREWKAGNPGFCGFKITDSLGQHLFNVDPAYNAVCDIENEKQRYGNKLINNIPYNEFPNPFVAKIYTSNEVAQHCIDTIGKIYLYFKEYELIKATAVNIY